MSDYSELFTEIPLDLPGKIYRSPMPFGPYDPKNQVWMLYHDHKIKLVVILVEKQEYLVHARKDLPAFYRENGLAVLHFPIPDFQVPEQNDRFSEAIDAVLEIAQAGDNLAIHCLAGIGRTGLFLACLAKRRQEVAGQKAIEWIRQLIPEAIENSAQENFVLEY
jgi:protein-tyrosine phosphatase